MAKDITYFINKISELSIKKLTGITGSPKQGTSIRDFAEMATRMYEQRDTTKPEKFLVEFVICLKGYSQALKKMQDPLAMTLFSRLHRIYTVTIPEAGVSLEDLFAAMPEKHLDYIVRLGKLVQGNIEKYLQMSHSGNELSALQPSDVLHRARWLDELMTGCDPQGDRMHQDPDVVTLNHLEHGVRTAARNKYDVMASNKQAVNSFKEELTDLKKDDSEDRSFPHSLK